MNIQPINHYVLLQLAEVTNMSAGGIIMQRETREQSGIVKAIGSQVTDVEVGQRVAFEVGEFKKVDDEHAIVLDKHIVGIYED